MKISSATKSGIKNTYIFTIYIRCFMKWVYWEVFFGGESSNIRTLTCNALNPEYIPFFLIFPTAASK